MSIADGYFSSKRIGPAPRRMLALLGAQAGETPAEGLLLAGFLGRGLLGSGFLSRGLLGGSGFRLGRFLCRGLLGGGLLCRRLGSGGGLRNRRGLLGSH